MAVIATGSDEWIWMSVVCVRVGCDEHHKLKPIMMECLELSFYSTISAPFYATAAASAAASDAFRNVFVS